MEQFPKNEEPNYKDLEVLNAILVKGDPGQLKKLKEKFNLTDKQVQRFSQFAKLREETIDATGQSVQERKKDPTTPSLEELNLGAYKEVLEPQVREAVFLLRKKGYPTFESGFLDFEGNQSIGLEAPMFKDVTLPKELTHELLNKGIVVKILSEAIELHLDRFISLDEIRQAWMDIAEALPDLGHPTAPKVQAVSGVTYAGFFR